MDVFQCKSTLVLHIENPAAVSQAGIADRYIFHGAFFGVQTKIKGNSIGVIRTFKEDVFENRVAQVNAKGMFGTVGFGGNNRIHIISRINVSEIGILQTHIQNDSIVAPYMQIVYMNVVNVAHPADGGITEQVMADPQKSVGGFGKLPPA